MFFMSNDGGMMSKFGLGAIYGAFGVSNNFLSISNDFEGNMYTKYVFPPQQTSEK